MRAAQVNHPIEATPTSRVEELKALLTLAGPIMLSQIGFVTMGVIDTAVVGRYSVEDLSAVAAGNVYHWSLLVVGMGILFALDPLVSQAYGARDDKAIGAWLHRALHVATLLGVIFFVVFQFADPVLRWFGQPAAIIPKASQFVRANAPGVWACFVFTVFRQALQATNRTTPVLLAVALGNVTNLIFNYLLVFGHLGFPELGAAGSGVATSISRFLMVVAVLYAGRKELVPSLTRRIKIGDLRDYFRFLKVGVPIGIQLGLETWAFMAVSLIMGRIGVTSLAGHQIAVQLSSLLFMIPFALGSASGIRVGQAIGRDDSSGARLSAGVVLVTGLLSMTLIALMLGIFPAFFAKIFTPDTEVIQVAMRFLPIVALFQVFDGLQGIGCGILRGAADTRRPAVIIFVGYWLVAIPVGYFLAFQSHLGPIGLWWGLAIGLGAVAILVVHRVISRFRLSLVGGGVSGKA